MWTMWLLWLGLAAFSVALAVLIWTRWGQYRPIRKCLLLSLLAHLLLAGYATTIKMVQLGGAIPDPVMRIAFVEGPEGPGDGPAEAAVPEPADDEALPIAEQAAAAEPAAAQADPPKPPAGDCPDFCGMDAAKMGLSPSGSPPPPPPQASPPEPAGPELDLPLDPEDAASAAGVEGPPAAMPASPAAPATAPSPPQAAAIASPGEQSAQRPMPDAYRLRVVPDRLGTACGGGGSAQTEAAVQAALRWLVDNQDPDGRWNAKQHEAGRDTVADGRSRPHAGLQADTGMTGLALLALLASGETHLRGPCQENVRRGLEYLLQTQAPNGSLAGSADLFAAMYCHAMATFALSEAYGMTGDQRLEPAVRRAIGYTLAAQDPNGGGWRYQPHDPGDTSQLGWQFMALRSAELAGIPLSEPTRQGVIRYLQSVASGPHGGWASYQPGEQPSRTMTAEALVAWQFLGLSREHPACNEAAEALLGELPGQGPPNFYYWYYATLATYHLQGDAWRQWNTALQTHLLATQQKTGPLAGSWDPDAVWGGYAGRIYSTSLGGLCLEVYYRYAPTLTPDPAAR